VIANIACAVVLYPILKRQSQSISLGYVASRTIESAIIAVGIISVLAAVTLRQDVGGAGAADGASLVLVGRSLVAIHDWTFLLGPAFCAGFGNGILLGYLMYKSGLVPRRMTMLGLIGGPLIFLSGMAIVLGAYDNGSTPNSLLSLPEIAWEASLTIYLIRQGVQALPHPRLRNGRHTRRVGLGSMDTGLRGLAFLPGAGLARRAPIAARTSALRSSGGPRSLSRRWP
jgi:hypothetical protein